MRKWNIFMQTFESSRHRIPHLFRSAAILTNFLRRRRPDMTAELQEGFGENSGGILDE